MAGPRAKRSADAAPEGEPYSRRPRRTTGDESSSATQANESGTLAATESTSAAKYGKNSAATTSTRTQTEQPENPSKEYTTTAPITQTKNKASTTAKGKENAKKEVVRPKWPVVSRTWSTFGDHDSARFLASAGATDEYKVGSLYFHARLALVVRGLSLDQLHNIFVSTLPPYLQDAPIYERNLAEKSFQAAHDAIEDRIVSRVKAYAESWIASAGGASYKRQQLHAKKQKKGWHPLVPNGDNIERYDNIECLPFDRINVTDLFLPCMSAVQTVIIDDRAGTKWLARDRIDKWYNALRRVGACLIVEVAKLIVDAIAASRAALRDSDAQDHLAVQVQRELSRPKIREILRTYQNFNLESDEYTPVRLAELALNPRITLRAPYSWESNVMAFQENSDTTPKVIQRSALNEDPLPLHVHEAKNRMDLVQAADPAVEAEEQEVQAAYQKEFDGNTSSIEEKYGLRYDRSKPYDAIGHPALDAEDSFNLGDAYVRKGPIGRIIMVRQDIRMEQERLAVLVMTALRKSKAMEIQLKQLDEEEEMRQTTQDLLTKTLAENKVAAAKVKSRHAAAMAPMSFGRQQGTQSAEDVVGAGAGFGDSGEQGFTSLPTDPAMAIERYGGGGGFLASASASLGFEHASFGSEARPAPTTRGLGFTAQQSKTRGWEPQPAYTIPSSTLSHSRMARRHPLAKGMDDSPNSSQSSSPLPSRKNSLSAPLTTSLPAAQTYSHPVAPLPARPNSVQAYSHPATPLLARPNSAQPCPPPATPLPARPNSPPAATADGREDSREIEEIEVEDPQQPEVARFSMSSEASDMGDDQYDDLSRSYL